MTPREKAIVAAIVAVSLGVRLIGVTWFPPNERELVGFLGSPLWVGRVISALATALAVLVIAWPRPGDGSFGRVAGLLLAFDPLSILAAHESPKAALLNLGGALLARSLGARRGFLIGVVAVAAFAFAWTMPGAAGSRSAEPALVAWYGDDHSALAIRLAAIHHLGYAVLPLALGSFLALRGFGGALLLLGLVLAGLGDRSTITDFAVVSPIVACCAAATIARLRAREVELGRAPLAIPASLALVLAVNAPVLASDALTGLRYPWNAVRAWLESRRDLDPATTIVHTTDVELARAALGPRFRIEPIDASAIIESGSTTQGAEGPRVIVIPVSSGIASGRSEDAPWLTRVESRKVPDFAPLARRFDLYRLELRVFVLDR